MPWFGLRRKSLPASHHHIAVISDHGGSNFVVASLDGGGGNVEPMVNEIGSYQGTRPLNFDRTPAAVEADGSWKKAPAWPIRSRTVDRRDRVGFDRRRMEDFVDAKTWLSRMRSRQK